jgi:lipopolysaccharide/colanic/teichoic acid biosynthesis glycosyltransferase
MYKFRTMIIGAEQKGSSITYSDDPRITRLGRLLRRTKLDEIPNLINVLKGEMSIVGPRPESPEWVELYTPEQREVLKARPGMTSLAQIEYRNEEELLDSSRIQEQYVQIMQEKLRLDLEYVRYYSFALDLKILAKAVWALLH